MLKYNPSRDEKKHNQNIWNSSTKIESWSFRKTGLTSSYNVVDGAAIGWRRYLQYISEEWKENKMVDHSEELLVTKPQSILLHLWKCKATCSKSYVVILRPLKHIRTKIIDATSFTGSQMKSQSVMLQNECQLSIQKKKIYMAFISKCYRILWVTVYWIPYGRHNILLVAVCLILDVVYIGMLHV